MPVHDKSKIRKITSVKEIHLGKSPYQTTKSKAQTHKTLLQA